VSAVSSETGDWVVPVLGGIAEIADRYDGFILDVWGVLHNGVEPYPRVVDTLYRLKHAGKRLCILSNAPVQAETVAGRIETIGIPRDAYHHIMTSGEEVWQHLKHRPDTFYRGLGRRVLHIGPERDKGMLDGLDLTRVEDPGEAEFVLNTGPGEPADTVATYRPLLDAALARKLPMVCANPDLTVMRGPEVLICAGSLAQAYEAGGGTVRWHGKPHAGVYRTCLALLGIADKNRIVGVGDSPRTDVAGANAAGIDSLLVAGGLHADEYRFVPGNRLDAQHLTRVLTDGPRPKAVVGRLNW
jgi:HAD superfamily hydrolase (TIGR01459 family)